MVYDELKTAIVRCQLPGHSRLIERDIAEDLGVSRTPVREAFLRLQRDGLLRAVPRRQRTLLEVTPLSARELRQTSAATGTLEAIGASEAAAQPRQVRLPLANELEGLLGAAEKEMARSVTFARALELDERFHHQLVDGFLAPSLKASLDAIRTLVYRYTWAFSRKSGVSGAQFRAEHAPMVAALRAGDAAAVAAALIANWSGFASRILPLLPPET